MRPNDFQKRCARIAETLGTTLGEGMRLALIKTEERASRGRLR